MQFLSAGMYEDLKEYLNWYDTRRDTKFAADAPVIGLVLQRSHLVTGDEGHYSGVVSELEAQGAKVMLLLFSPSAVLVLQLQQFKVSRNQGVNLCLGSPPLCCLALCTAVARTNLFGLFYLYIVAFLVFRNVWQSCSACDPQRTGDNGSNGQLSKMSWHCMAKPCTSCWAAHCCLGRPSLLCIACTDTHCGTT